MNAAARSQVRLRLPFPALLAARYLRSSRRDAFVTVLAALAACGIAIGSAALVLVLAALSGLQAFLRDDVLERTPHIEISLPRLAEENQAVATEVLATRLAGIDGVSAVHRVVRGRGWVLVAGTPRTIELVGIGAPCASSAGRYADEADAGLPHVFPGAMRAEGAPLRGIWLGTAQAAAWGMVAGEVVELVSPRPSLSPFGPVPRVVRLPFVGTFRTGRTEQPAELRAAIPLAAAERLFGSTTERLVVEAHHRREALGLAADFEPLLPPGAHLETWQDLNRPLFFALRLERSVMFLSVFLIVPVAAMALVTALALLVAAKRSEIGMLRAMGARAADVRRAFGYLGGAIGAFGVASGITIGAAAAVVLDRAHLISPPGNVYFVDHLPFRVEALDVVLVAVAAGAMALAATAWAARRAAQLEPIEAMRR